MKLKSRNKLFAQLTGLQTEQKNSSSSRIDTASISTILAIINKEDRRIASAVAKEIPLITKAVKLVVGALQDGGRLFYFGAGTSGRLGVLDAAECPPTFGTNPETIKAVIAGGRDAVFRAQEGSEDNTTQAVLDVRRLHVGKKDVVCGIAASARTPYVIAAIMEAKKRGAKTIYVTTNPRSTLRTKNLTKLRHSLDVAICPVVGPEVIMGSTRMKSGTAQKLVLNMISTASMIRLGKVYENMMIDLQMNSAKLEERAKRVIMFSTGANYETASDVLLKAGGHVKTAIVMIKSNVSARQARERLKKAGGFVRRAITHSRQ